MKLFTALTSLLLAPLFSACSGAAWVNFFSIDLGSCESRDLVFDTLNHVRVDLYYPNGHKKCSGSGVGTEEKPTIVFVHGGSWNSGDKDRYSFVADFFTDSGYTVAIPEYRLFPQVAYPEFIRDLETFFSWYAETASLKGLNSENVIVIAHSAGAYNVATYLSDDRYEKAVKLQAFIGLAGPYNFFLPTQNSEYLPIFTRTSEKYNSSSELPVNLIKNSRISKHLKRALLLHGEDDSIVTPKNVDDFLTALQNAGVRTEGKIYQGKDHVAMVSGITLLPILRSNIRSDILSFIGKDQELVK